MFLTKIVPQNCINVYTYAYKPKTICFYQSTVTNVEMKLTSQASFQGCVVAVMKLLSASGRVAYVNYEPANFQLQNDTFLSSQSSGKQKRPNNIENEVVFADSLRNMANYACPGCFIKGRR